MESGPDNAVTGQLNVSVSQPADAELTTPDVKSDHITKKYYEVHLLQFALK